MPIKSIPKCGLVLVKLLKGGLERIPHSQIGQTFMVEDFTSGQAGDVAHIRDYRFPSKSRDYQVWSLAGDQYEVLFSNEEETAIYYGRR